MKISLHTDFTATALCGAVAEATYRLEDWIASDGGALISVNNNKNLTMVRFLLLFTLISTHEAPQKEPTAHPFTEDR